MMCILFLCAMLMSQGINNFYFMTVLDKDVLNILYIAHEI